MLNLRNSPLTSIHPFAFNGSVITTLILGQTKIKEIPIAITALHATLTHLDVFWTEIKTIPPNIFNGSVITKLILRYTRITEMPIAITALHATLTHLDVSFTLIKTIPPYIFKDMKVLEHLDLSLTGITPLLSSQFMGLDNSLEKLYLQDMRTPLKAQSDTFCHLKMLKFLFIRSTSFKQLRSSLECVTTLEYLELGFRTVTVMDLALLANPKLATVTVIGGNRQKATHECTKIPDVTTILCARQQRTKLEFQKVSWIDLFVKYLFCHEAKQFNVLRWCTANTRIFVYFTLTKLTYCITPFLELPG